MTPKLVVFDIAGTTLNDSEDTVSAAFTRAIEEHNINIGNHDIRWVMGYRKIEAIEMLLTASGITADTHIIKSIHDRFIQILNTHYASCELAEYEGISELFSSLHDSGVKVAINTGFSDSTTAIIVERLGWIKRGLVDATISSNQVPQGRPHPDMIQSLMQQFDISSPRSVAKVGDTPSDLLEGKNTGCGLTIGVLYGTHSRDELEQHPHDHLVSSVAELHKLLVH